MKTEFRQINIRLSDEELAGWKNAGWELIFFAVDNGKFYYIFKR